MQMDTQSSNKIKLYFTVNKNRSLMWQQPTYEADDKAQGELDVA